jgi:dihydrofolate reductase
MSLDGFIATERPSGTDEFVGAGDDELDQWIVDSSADVGTLIMGRVTYEAMAEFWPNSTEIFAAPMNAIPKVVFSKSLTGATWNESTIASGDTVEEIEKLKAQPGGQSRLSAASRSCSPWSPSTWSTSTACCSARTLLAAATPSSATCRRSED